jgi:hypothetical protein
MRRLREARRQATALVAALALLCAQAIGLAHAVAHPQAGVHPAIHGAHHDPGHEHDPAHDHGLFDAQHDEGSPQCQLFDQLSHGDSLAVPALAWSFAAPEPAFSAAPAASVRATCACGYHARGPPSFLA